MEVINTLASTTVLPSFFFFSKGQINLGNKRRRFLAEYMHILIVLTL